MLVIMTYFVRNYSFFNDSTFFIESNAMDMILDVIKFKNESESFGKVRNCNPATEGKGINSIPSL